MQEIQIIGTIVFFNPLLYLLPHFHSILIPHLRPLCFARSFIPASSSSLTFDFTCRVIPQFSSHSHSILISHSFYLNLLLHSHTIPVSRSPSSVFLVVSCYKSSCTLNSSLPFVHCLLLQSTSIASLSILEPSLPISVFASLYVKCFYQQLNYSSIDSQLSYI